MNLTGYVSKRTYAILTSEGKESIQSGLYSL